MVRNILNKNKKIILFLYFSYTSTHIFLNIFIIFPYHKGRKILYKKINKSF